MQRVGSCSPSNDAVGVVCEGVALLRHDRVNHVCAIMFAQVWHCFVMIGSIIHYFVILFHVVGLREDDIPTIVVQPSDLARWLQKMQQNPESIGM